MPIDDITDSGVVDVLELSLKGTHGNTRHIIRRGEPCRIGSGDEVDLQIGDPTVSREHLEIRWDGNSLSVCDLGSRNGTRIAGKKIKAHASETVAEGSALQIGEVDIVRRRLRAGDGELVLSLDQPLEVSARQPASATLAPAPIDAFSRNALPALLDHLQSACTRTDFARRLGEALYASLPLAMLEISAHDEETVTDHGMLFAAPRPMNVQERDAAEAHRLSGVHFVAQWNPGYTEKAFDPVWRIVEGLLKLCVEPEFRQASKPANNRIATTSLDTAVQSIYRRARRAAVGGIHVLIRGESGTGKEVLARFIHAEGGKDRPFEALNCAALPTDLLEAELFGVESRVATGVDARAGIFERANGGCLFLDEIGDMAATTQARILRVLQEGEVTRVGGSRSRPARVQVISATNKPIEKMVAEGSFRLDLLHRISDWEVTLPPLRERLVDIGNLALYFLARAANERGIALSGITRSALDALIAYEWPGNIRELEREIGRIAVFLDPGAAVTSADLRVLIRDAGANAPDTDASLEAQLAHAEQQIIQKTLTRLDGNISAAADALGVSRATLYRRLALPAEHD